MKKGPLLNSHLSHLVSLLGHTDQVTIADAGLPIPETTDRIDLALIRGIPSFLETLGPLLDEIQVESVLIAEEIKQHNPEMHQKLTEQLKAAGERQQQEIQIEYLSHQAFKQRTASSYAVIRTGECSPYANIILQAGVAF